MYPPRGPLALRSPRSTLFLSQCHYTAARVRIVRRPRPLIFSPCVRVTKARDFRYTRAVVRLCVDAVRITLKGDPCSKSSVDRRCW
jgi:hypothetical protein